MLIQVIDVLQIQPNRADLPYQFRAPVHFEDQFAGAFANGFEEKGPIRGRFSDDW